MSRAVAADAEVGHGVPRDDGLRGGDPAHEVRRRVRRPSGDVRAPRPAGERRPDRGLPRRAADAWDAVTARASVWLADHYMPDTGTTEPASGDLHEVWGLLPAVAAVTERVRVGTLVSPTSVHHPALLANRASTVDHVSGGRMVLGIGAGWQLNEHAAYGFHLESRVSRFEEAIQIVRSLLAQPRTSFHGRFYEIADAPCDPKPLQQPLPI